MQTFAKSPAQLRSTFWLWAYVASFVLAALLFFQRPMEWGSNADEAWIYYTQGLRPWADILTDAFLPKEAKTFVFGTDRPMIFSLYFKLAHQFELGPGWLHYITAFGAWLSNLIFAFGLVSLLRLSLTLPPYTPWVIALITWWSPTYLFTAGIIFPDCWIIYGAIALFWILIYGNNKTFLYWLPILDRPYLRFIVAGTAVFFALQSRETSWIILIWTTLWLGSVKLTQKSYKKNARHLSWANVLLPSFIVLAHILIYRSLEPMRANRTEFTLSFDFSSLVRVAQTYLLMGFNALSDPFVTWFDINPKKTGISAATTPLAAVLTLSSFAFVLKQKKSHLTWLLPFAGVLCTLPFLIIVDRQLFYYVLNFQLFLNAFFAIRLCLEKRFILPFALNLFAAMIINYSVFFEWNWLMDFGAYNRDMYSRLQKIPGVESCSSQNPCCLSIPGRTWNNNEWVMNWLAGAPKKPIFVEPGNPCTKTIQF